MGQCVHKSSAGPIIHTRVVKIEQFPTSFWMLAAHWDLS